MLHRFQMLIGMALLIFALFAHKTYAVTDARQAAIYDLAR